jgi:hypothetical protein
MAVFVKLREDAPMFEYAGDENPRHVPKSSSDVFLREFRSITRFARRPRASIACSSRSRASPRDL